MGQYDIDKDVYKNWLEGTVLKIEAMTTRESIEERINEIAKIEFFAKREWALLHQQYDKITGRKGIAPWLKEERNKLVTDPNFKVEVDWEGEPRKKEKKPKQDMAKDFLGIDMSELTASLKGKKDNGVKPPTPQPKQSMSDAISSLINVKPKVETPKTSPDEIKAKADAMKEKLRLIAEAKKNKQ